MKMRARLRGWATASVLPALLLWLAQAGGAPHTIEDQTLRYAVSYGGRNAGEIEITIRNQNDGYVVTSTSKPNALASLFVKAHLSDTRFVRRRGEVVLDGGAESLAGNGGSGYARSFRFDHAAGRVKFSDGKSSAIQPGDRFEAAAFPLLLMLRPVDGVKGRVREVSAKRTRDYRYEQPVAETVTVPAGAFASWKINRHRTDRPADTVTVWLSRAGNPVPLKIVIRKRGKTSTLMLTGLSG